MDKITEASLLYDFYGELLTEKQRQVMAFYHEENLSLSEIATEFGITRQAVHDTLKKAEQSLTEYEKKLRLVDQFMKSTRAISQIDREIDEIAAFTQDRKILEKLAKMKDHEDLQHRGTIPHFLFWL